MSNLKDIVYCSEEQLKTMASGTPVGDHTYNETDLYITPLGDDIIVGPKGSKTHINENNQLAVDALNENEVKTMINNALNAIGVAEERSY